MIRQPYSFEGYTRSDAQDEQVIWAVPELEPGEVVTGTFQALAGAAATGEAISTQAIISAPGLSDSVDTWAVTEVGSTITYTDAVWVTPDGAVIQQAVEPLNIIFAEDTVTEPLQIQIETIPVAIAESRRVSDSPAAPQASSEVRETPPLLEVFELTATDMRGSEVTTFTHPLTFTVNLTDYVDEYRARDGSPSLYWLNETTGAWELVPSEVDWQSLTLVAQVDHFSLYALSTTDQMSFGRPYVTSVTGFHADEFSGNNSVQYPFMLPPAPAVLG